MMSICTKGSPHLSQCHPVVRGTVALGTGKDDEHPNSSITVIIITTICPTSLVPRIYVFLHTGLPHPFSCTITDSRQACSVLSPPDSIEADQGRSQQAANPFCCDRRLARVLALTLGWLAAETPHGLSADHRAKLQSAPTQSMLVPVLSLLYPIERSDGFVQPYSRGLP
jgi:hypothetical protein